ncbi:unnamed protein product [Paramecium sonneborni]|uniref:Uncharacterized protein n=1 Tax=Paramecium sonneborni TaxID=65129 RepID=A0A8S1LSK4_9CILI|nr:unnamed protein product [Paramecium sonneborni]
MIWQIYGASLFVGLLHMEVIKQMKQNSLKNYILTLSLIKDNICFNNIRMPLMFMIQHLILTSKQTKLYEKLQQQASYRKTLIKTCLEDFRNRCWYIQKSQTLSVIQQLQIRGGIIKIYIKHQYILYIGRCQKYEFQRQYIRIFNTVLDTFGLEYYLNPEKVISEMKRVYKPGKINWNRQGGKIFTTYNWQMQL